MLVAGAVIISAVLGAKPGEGPTGTGTGTVGVTGTASGPATSRILMRDDFDGEELDTVVWGTCHWWSDEGCTIASNDELEWYLPEQVSVSDGVLRLTAERRDVETDDGRTLPYVSGMISTGPPHESDTARFAFLYGRAEMRARVPAGAGLWSAFWLLPEDKASRPEIDVMEILGDSPDVVRMHYHYLDGDAERDPGRNWSGPDSSGDWHTYAIDWLPGVLVWLVDGEEVWRIEGEEVPDEPMYLIANLAVGGDWPGPPDESTRFPAALEIDSITVTSG